MQPNAVHVLHLSIIYHFTNHEQYSVQKFADLFNGRTKNFNYIMLHNLARMLFIQICT